jgi:hypothetical protein
MAACFAIDRLTENALDVNAWMPTCPHSVSLFDPVSASQKDVAHCLAPEAALALIGVGPVDGMQVGAEADLACAHLCDGRADRPT